VRDHLAVPLPTRNQVLRFGSSAGTLMSDDKNMNYGSFLLGVRMQIPHENAESGMFQAPLQPVGTLN
jgi:hypothetical protein